MNILDQIIGENLTVKGKPFNCKAKLGDVLQHIISVIPCPVLVEIAPDDPNNPDDPAFDCTANGYEIGQVLWFGGTEQDPDYTWEVVVNVSGDCIVIIRTYPDSPSANISK